MNAAALSAEGLPAPPYRKAWCPGALRPMETGDGLLARVRAHGGRLSLAQGVALADAAVQCGSGVIGLSARANLHLRGLSEAALPDLHARLGAIGLLDADPEVERLRNIVVSPLDDLDPQAALDLGPSVAALEARLKTDERLRRLPAKFGFVVDAQGRLPLGDVDADIRFEATRDGALTIFLAGDDELAAQCAPDAIGDVAARLGIAFLALAGSSEAGPRRMRALVEVRGAATAFAAAGCETRPRRRSQQRVSLHDVLGAQVYGATVAVGAAAPFGEIDASRFKALLDRARALGATGVRLTPWRAFLMVGLDSRGAQSMIASVAELGFIADAYDPRLRVAACPGAPACMHGHRRVRDDAARWAAMAPNGEGVVLHVSGCAKGCARPTATAATLTATATGYDLVLSGKAGDPPARRGLSCAETTELLKSESASLFGERRPSP